MSACLGSRAAEPVVLALCLQIDQSSDPTRITIAGKEEQVGLATNMVADIVTGHFKGFAMLRQLTTGRGPQMPPGFEHVKLPTPKYMPPLPASCLHSRYGTIALQTPQPIY